MTWPPDPDQHVIEDETAIVVDDTIDTLVLVRRHPNDTNAAAELDAVSALIAQARSRLPDLVADARDQDNTWAEIANQLGTNRLHAIARYARHARTRRTPIEPD